jgi:cell division protein FtsN
MGFGVNALDNFSIGYIYEYPINKLNKFSVNTHELMVSYRFSKNKSKNEGEIQSDLQTDNNYLQLQEQYDQLQLRVQSLADEIKQNRKEQEALKNELTRKQLADEKIARELEKDKSDEVSDAEDLDKVDINLPENFENDKFDYFIVIGAYHGLSHAKHFQKTIQKGKGMETQILKAKNSAFYFVYTTNVTSKKEANTELSRLNRIDFNGYFKSRIWIHKEPK